MTEDAPAGANQRDDTLATTIDDRLDDYREALFEVLSQPSISTTGKGMDAAGDLVVDTLSDQGLDARRIATDRHPLVYAERGPADGDESTDDNLPTVLFYGHYDVQPPGDEDEWDSPAFEPTVRDGAVYARGAGDNKGQFLAHAFAVDALLAADAFPDVRVKLLVEGGEESGSAGLREYLRGGRGERGAPTEIADADLVYVADGPQHAVVTERDGERVREGTPTLIYGNRGILSAELECRTANTDLHSGNFGGPVPAATNELVAALDSVRGEDGDEIVVDGFHDGTNVTDADRELVAAIPDDSAAIAEELALSGFASDDPYYERLLTRPTLTINGLSGGYQAEGMKTVLPATASAKIDCRLVPDQDPDAVFEALRDHFAAVSPDLELTKRSTFPPMKTPVDTPLAEPVAGALEAVWGTEPVELPVLGGSLPAAHFREVPSLADVPVLVVPYANHDQGNHSPNEHLDLRCFENGIRTSARVIRALASR
ncbi:M20/M25/M40 family metallo-hydrolase [Halorubrum gandharaense]